MNAKLKSVLIPSLLCLLGLASVSQAGPLGGSNPLGIVDRLLSAAGRILEPAVDLDASEHRTYQADDSTTPTVKVEVAATEQRAVNTGADDTYMPFMSFQNFSEESP